MPLTSPDTFAFTSIEFFVHSMQTQKYASTFCKKGLPNYEQLTCELFSHSFATRKLHHASTISSIDTDQKRDIEDRLIGLGIDDNHDRSNTCAPSSIHTPLTPRTISGKKAIDSTSSVHHRSKWLKGKSAADTNSTTLLKFVGAQDRGNNILEQWIAMKSKSPYMIGPSQDGADGANDPYTKCLILMQSMMEEDENAVFLKACKELENAFTQKTFLVMSDA